MSVKNGRSLARSEHRKHDRLLVTRFAMDDAYPGELAEARSLIAACTECATIARDIRLIAASVSRLPRPVRTRDFTISAEQAERLKGSRLSRWLRSLSSPGWAALRPISAAALSIGLVMAVVGASLPQSAGAPTFRDSGVTESGPLAGDAPAPTFAAAPPADGGPKAPGAGAPEAPPDVVDPVNGFETLASQDPVTQEYDTVYLDASPESGESRTSSAGRDDVMASPADPARDLLVYSGLLIAAASLGLLVLAWIARRRFADPLLR